MTFDLRLCALIAVGVITIAGLIFSYKKMKDGFGPFNLKVYGITLVLGLSGIVVLTDIDTNKLTAVFGIIGTIAGYLFGINNKD